MKRFLVLAALTAGLLIALASYATTTWSTGTAGLDNNSLPYTPVIGTSTTETEAAPSAIPSGHSLTMAHAGYATNIVITAKAHIIVNTAPDAGIYDPTDASAAVAMNTFGPYGQLRCWVLDNANANTTWTRYPAGDKTLTAGDTSATIVINVSDMPRVSRVAFMPYRTNIPVKITYSER